ncbi:MAG: hypothetical protein JW751_02815 [Polyangiaceae bacterium]|nr:hypothetical protein [Polyangiaceae bacterium]
MCAVSLVRSSLVVLGSLALAACAASTATPPATPTTGPTETVATAAEPPSPPKDFSAIPPAPADCDPYAAHPAPSPCKVADDGRAALAAAIVVPDRVSRDAALAELQACSVYPPGVILALRAELTPPECGDVIVGDLAARAEVTPDTALRDALVGIHLAAQLDRLVGPAPELEPPFDKERFQGFLRDVLTPWITGQAEAIQTLSERGARLSGYGKGIVAVHAGLADMRFVAAVRAVPLPTELAADNELKDTYYGSLDEALEPRKVRGRDAALVGLRLLSEVGVLDDPRIARARALLSEVYAGRRIDALDQLLLPPLEPVARKTPTLTLAAGLPTFYLGRFLPEVAQGTAGPLGALDEPSRIELATALLERGLAPTVRTALEAQDLAPAARYAFGRALVRSGQLYWRASDFQQAAQLLGKWRGGDRHATDATLLLAVAEALGKGAKDAVEMMSRGAFPLGRPDVTVLDRLARGKGEPAARAAYDAALILGLAPPEAGGKAFFQDLDRRYREAALLATDLTTKTEATERARAAAATAAVVAE